MANMIKLPYETGGNLCLNVDGAYDATWASNSSIAINYAVSIDDTGVTKWFTITLDFNVTGIDLTPVEADLLTATIAKASQATNSQPVFSPQGYSLKENNGVVVSIA